jgi:hypothetical protein
MKKLQSFQIALLASILSLVSAFPANAQFADKLAILVVANSTTPNAAELAINQRLLDVEFDVQIVAQADANDAVVVGAHLLLISATVSSGTVATNMPGLAGYEIPIINWEPALYDELGFSAAGGGEFGATEIEIVDAAHPLAAGLPAGLVTIVTVSKQLSFGQPQGEVNIIGVNAADPTQVVLFGYEKGAAMAVGNAPARRVGTFLLNDVADSITDEGAALFDSSVVWAMAGGTTSVSEKESTVPSEYVLYNNYPNPFNPSTSIPFSVPKRSQVQLTVWNSLGEKVATVVNEVRTAGEYTATFDASGLPSGIYFYKLEAGNTRHTKKMLFLK